MLSAKLLEILRCPACRHSLTYEEDKNTLTCKNCGKIYPVRDNIPILIDEQARRE